LAIASIIDPEKSAVDIADHVRAGVTLVRAVDLPPEAEDFRADVRAVIDQVRGLQGNELVRALVTSGYAVPHWPAPWGRDASAIEQLVIEDEFTKAGIKKPSYQITGWVILTLTQYANDDQVARWIKPALDQELIWCQLFSEPDAGSDAAGVKTKATRVDGGWLINGQKVWTTGAHLAAFGLVTVRTDPDAPKHNGITTMVIDMHAEGVEIRPLRMVNGGAEFNEVFFDDVFVPDDDVVGPVDAGWTVARGTLGNESVSIGSGDGAMVIPPTTFLAPFAAHPERLSGGAGRIGRAIARSQAAETLNVRSAQRAVASGGPGPEGAVTKLLLTENAEEAAAILHELSGPDGAYLEGDGFLGGTISLMHRALAIAGGTSEIKRNQIGERILGLPRDPLIN
jgi:alkylation response protein AidB-like acyl-CoA dehydrogenase